MQSHEHGFGKFRREAWGAKEDCYWCMAYERDQEKAMKDAREDFKVNYAPLLETTVVDADGIIRDLPPGFDEPIFREQEDTCNVCGNHGSVTTFGDCHKCYIDTIYEHYLPDTDPVNELIANEREYVDNITREAVFGLAFIVIGLFSFAVILTALEGK